MSFNYLKIGILSQVSEVAAIGVFAGGELSNRSSSVTTIDYISIATTGNATDFGDLTRSRGHLASCSSSTRGIFCGGLFLSYMGTTRQNVIDYITFSTISNATDFGDYVIGCEQLAGCSSSTRGLFGGGVMNSYTSGIYYITIATTSNSTNFGYLTTARRKLASCGSTTRGVWAGGSTSSLLNVIDYVTIATTGNATDFGDYSYREGMGGCSSSTRGVFGGGGYVSSTYTSIIEYITIATTGNSTNFGYLTSGRMLLSSTSSSIRGVFVGGSRDDYSNPFNIIDYVTIATTGNATDFGDLTQGRTALSGCSNSHGGL